MRIVWHRFGQHGQIHFHTDQILPQTVVKFAGKSSDVPGPEAPASARLDERKGGFRLLPGAQLRVEHADSAGRTGQGQDERRASECTR